MIWFSLLRALNSSRWLFLAAAVGLGGISCQSTSRPQSALRNMTYDEAAYATEYLGAGGQVIRDPRSRNASSQSGREVIGTRHRNQEPGFWDASGVTGSSSIVVDLSDQRARFYKGGKLVGESPISTGRAGYRTPTGRFRVTQKNADHRSNLYGDYVTPAGDTVVANIGVRQDPRPPGSVFRGAEMPYFLRVAGPVGLHGGHLPGYPASHGCIRLPMGMAERFYANASHGTPVTIQQ